MSFSSLDRIAVRNEFSELGWPSLALSSVLPAESISFLEHSWCLESDVCLSPSSTQGGRFPFLFSLPPSLRA